MKSLFCLPALAVACLLLLMPGRTFADDRSYPMIVRGGPGITASYANGILTVQIRKARSAAGSSLNYGKLPGGSAAWVDRPLTGAEPFVLKQKIDEQHGQVIIERLRDNNGYWKFYCRLTSSGYFEVNGSESSGVSMRID